MRSYSIDDILMQGYAGAGWAIGAVRGGALVDFFYVRDFIADVEDRDLEQALSSLRLSPAIDYLTQRGALVVGMCSCGDFVVA
jgi:hypothetical protein